MISFASDTGAIAPAVPPIAPPIAAPIAAPPAAPKPPVKAAANTPPTTPPTTAHVPPAENPDTMVGIWTGVLIFLLCMLVTYILRKIIIAKSTYTPDDHSIYISHT